MVYIQSESRRFYVYVTNRIQIIQGLSDPPQWKYIYTHRSPADLPTRGLTVKNLARARWFEGPEFIGKRESQTDIQHMKFGIQSDDPEIRPQITSHTTQLCFRKGLNAERFKRFSSWSSFCRALANLIVMVREWKERKKQLTESNGNIVSHCQSSDQSQRSKPPRLPSPEELRQAELIMIKAVQKENFNNEIEILRKPMSEEKGRRQTASVGVLKRSSLCRLDPFLDKDGVLRVGGRFRRSKSRICGKTPYDFT